MWGRLGGGLLFVALWISPLVGESEGVSAQSFRLTDRGYFQSGGVDVMAFDDIYPEGHQGGVSVIMHGNRVATNGDLRLEETPGQWQAVPKQLKRTAKDNTISTTLCYPDSSRHMTGFNPMVYPDLLTFPFLWQQTEYVLGGGSSNYLFLVLAAKQLLSE